MHQKTLIPVLIEHCRRARRVLAAWALLAITALALTVAPQAQAQNAQAAAGIDWAHGKGARDLNQALNAPSPHHRWSRGSGAQRQVQVIVTSQSADPELSDLRAAVLRLGGAQCTLAIRWWAA